MTEREWHRKQASSLFNRTWSLLEKRKRTQREDDEMIHAAHASRYHWGVVGRPVNLAIGEWQISHVYAVLKRPEPATYHAKRCLDICREHHIGDFPLAFAFEALARSAALDGRRQDRDRFMRRAHAAGQRIRGEDDRKLFFSDLATIRKPRRRGSPA